MIGEILVVLAVAWPLALGATLTVRRTMASSPAWSWVVCMAPVPALVAALAVGESVSVELPWLLLGSRWEIDSTRRALLAAAALIWLLAGWQMRARFTNETHRISLQLGWLLAFAGNVGVMLVHDVAGLYAFFALMSFSAYPLVVLARTPEALAAGRVYVAMTVLGEVLILSGLLIASRGLVSPQLSDLHAALAASPQAAVASLCLWTGFGVKTAVVGLHMWLPGAYTHAPPPVSAVLGGAMINAGVLGLLVTLPLGAMSLTTLGSVIVGAGLVGAFGGAAVGVMQRQSTTVLGYSSISQMGMLMMPLGAALHTPAVAPAAITAIILFAVHHGFVKASLFLGVDVSRRSHVMPRTAVLALLLLVGASLSGAPFTSGAAAKLATKYVLADVASTWPWLVTALSLAAVGSTLLVLRAVWCVSQESTGRVGNEVADTREAVLSTSEYQPSHEWPLGWLLSFVLVITGVWWLPLPTAVRAWPGSSTSDTVALSWPILLGLVLAATALWASARHALPRWRIPAGDVLVPLRALWLVVLKWIKRGTQSIARLVGVSNQPSSDDSPRDAVAHMQAWRKLRTLFHVEQPSQADATLRSVAPIVFGALIVVVVVLLHS